MNKGLWRSARLPFVLTFLMKTKLPCILTFLVNLGLWCLRCRVSSFATGGPWIGLSHQHAPRVSRLHPSQSPQAFLRGRAARWLLFGWIRVLGSSVKRVDRAESYRLPYVGLFYRWCIRDFLKKINEKAITMLLQAIELKEPLQFVIYKMDWPCRCEILVCCTSNFQIKITHASC